jgi:hypothetical protein|nr:MAG TPA: hypothetical protein [Caudoviricetes sp.]
MKKLITLNKWVELFPSIQTIFDKVSTDLKLFTIFTSAEMFSYFVNKFGERDFYKYYDSENTVNNTNMVKQASDYIALYGKSHKYEYDKLVDTLSLEYNPIENYSMTEKGTDTRTPNITQTNKGVNTNTVGVDTSITTGKTTFDKSDSFINDTKTTNTGTNTDTQDINTTVTTAGNEKTVHEFTRSGNIGVTTSQQMIESERQLAMFSVVDLFIKAIADIILIGVY